MSLEGAWQAELGEGARQRENTVLGAHSRSTMVASYRKAARCVAVRTRGRKEHFPLRGQGEGGFLGLSPEGGAGAEGAAVAPRAGVGLKDGDSEMD